MFGFPGFAGGTDKLVRTGNAPTPSAPAFAPLADYAADSPIGVFGLRLLIGSYSGPLAQLIRVSDEDLYDCTFDPSTGEIDTAAIDAWIGASQARLYVWYDQSGNSADLRMDPPGTPAPGRDFSDFLYSSSVANLGGRPGFVYSDVTSDNLLSSEGNPASAAPHSFIFVGHITLNPSGSNQVTASIALAIDALGTLAEIEYSQFFVFDAEVSFKYNGGTSKQTEAGPINLYVARHDGINALARSNQVDLGSYVVAGDTIVATSGLTIIATGGSVPPGSVPTIEMAELFYYDANKTTLGAIETDIYTRYGF
jgi:hypothetical protein